MKEKNIYFPCLFIKHEDDYFSIICSQFHYFDDYFGEKEGGGYTIEKLAKKLVKENTIKSIKYDSEAGMFCAYSNNSKNLLELCELLREITGEEEKHFIENVEPLISFEEAEKLLLKGYIKSLDNKAQKDFLKNVPMPSLSKKQAKYLNDIHYGTDEEKIYSAKRMNSEARTNTRNWDNYLSHPNTTTIILESIDKTETPKVYEELLGAMVFICSRHLPDLRTQPYFLKALKSTVSRNRELGIWGLKYIYDYPFKEILPLINDKSFKVKNAVLGIISIKNFDFASWMFDPQQKSVNKRPKDFSAFYPLFNDKNRKVRIEALEVIIDLEEHELFPKLKELIPIYKESMKNEESDYMKGEYREVIERLEKMK